MNREKPSFEYTYSAKEREEIKKIRTKYEKKAEDVADPMLRLRLLDASTTRKATVISLVIGILGALLLGLGMSLVMTRMGEYLGAYRDLAMPIGIGVGLVGIFLVILAYPIYTRTVRRERERIAPEILRLTDELMK